jgi:hypothetical protein
MCMERVKFNAADFVVCEVSKCYDVVSWCDLVFCSRSVTGKYFVVLQYFNVCSINHQGVV